MAVPHPGLPIAIVQPHLKITLIDSIRKKLAFVDNIITKLNLHDTKVLNMRAEDLGRDKIFREKFDVATARAVAYLPTLVEYTLPLVKVGGIFIAQKSASDEEIQAARQAIRTLGGQIKEIKKYQLPGLDERALIIIEKIEKTPEIFPRLANEIKSDPL
jgi:16S rRNA (guanine527-N7)-methyltransferase